MRRLVIIGNSAAGLAAIEAIRSRDRRSRVTLIAAERHLPYSRILLTYLLAGKIRRDELFLHGRDWYEQMGVEAMTGHRAVEIDTRRRHVVVERSNRARSVSDGPVSQSAGARSGRKRTFSSASNRRKQIPYDRLLIATGASAQRPALPGIELPGVFCLRDLDDATAIMRNAEARGMSGRACGEAPAGALGAGPGFASRVARPRSRDAPGAVFLGGGPVCLQALVAFAHRGMRVSLLVRSPAILSQLADPYTAGLAGKVLRANGVQVITGVDVVGIEGRSKTGLASRLCVHTHDGGRLETDLVIIGKGTKPNTELARGTEIATDVGILVDETMASSAKGVFAAGDVAQARHCVTGRKVCYGTWTNACEQGRIAGLNMVGCRVEWIGGLNRNVTAFFGHTLGSVGVFGARPADWEMHHYENRRRGISRRLLFRDGRCDGAVLWNACDDMGVLGWLISTRRDCSGLEARLTRGLGSSAEAMRKGLIPGADGPCRGVQAGGQEKAN